MNDDIKQILGEILASVKTLESRITRLEVGGASSESSIAPTVHARMEKKVSVKEFLIEHAPSDGVQMTLAIAYYLETQEGTSPFNKTDLEKGFRSAKESIPKNINDKVNMCIKNGHMMEAEAKKDSMKAWVITRRGEQYVEEKFGRKD